ncbi:SDR family oxidoreductase [candidate division KSB1 bacterium]|jgi:NAD(P)-dependent dehydrogenase (short-subunit alcohol dehydrogenase family)|nr:SDR family oxidoreductase [candidate division KSB1 bacterium]
MFQLDGQVAAVIGGGGVLAGSMAEALGKAGAKVAILDLNMENAEKIADQVAQSGTETMAIQVDATSKKDLADADEKIANTLGHTSILINAPGINSSTPFFDISEQEWQKILDVNLKSMFFACQVFAKNMIEKAIKGSIINISSASSELPLSKVFTYSVSKAGVNNMTRFLAREWATQGLRVNAIAPGFFPAEQNRKILTEERIADIMRHTPMNRFGEAEELGGAVIWLASYKASSFVTGALLRVDGGYTAMTI